MDRMTLKEKNNVIKRKKSGKYKYVYPLTKEIRTRCLELKKPYPKMRD